MKKIKRLFTFAMALMIALSCFGISVSAVESDAPDDNGNMELDVVFVLDSSGSMAESDPNRVAPDAFKLFVDLCDDSCGVGYTIYSEKIKESENITALDQKHLNELRSKIAQMNTNPYGDTDIGLGLSKAFEIHKASKDFDSNRKKAVILLSDGNTHLIDNSKSPEQLKKEIDSALTSLSENNIPVYAIGLNYDGTLDKKETQNIADKTHGKAYETKSSNELPGIISDIFADIYSINGSQKEITKDGNVEIYIKDRSVFYVNIVIRSRLSIDELNPVLLNPRRENMDLSGGDKNIKMTTTGSYTLIKLIYPTSGRWKLHLDNATNENCIVTQLDFYSIFVKQKIFDLDNTIVLGQETRIEATLNKTDSIIDDPDLIDDISMTTTIIGGKEPITVKLEKQSNSSFSGSFFIQEEGNYKIITEATSDKFRKESLPLELTVKKYTDEEIAKIRARTHTDIPIDAETSLPTSDNPVDYVLLIAGFLGVIVLIIAAVIVVLKIRERNENQALSAFSAEPDDAHRNYDKAPKESAPEIERVKEGPKATDPDYVYIPIVEHGSLESLIKKGPDEAFNANADDYKVDESLEAIIRKGPDNNLGVGKAEEDFNDFDNTQDEGYQSGNNLSEMFGGLDDEGPVNLNKKNNNS